MTAKFFAPPRATLEHIKLLFSLAELCSSWQVDWKKKGNWWKVPVILYLYSSDRLPVQDHHQSLCLGVWRAPSAAPLSTSLHNLHPVGLLRDGRGEAVRGGPSAKSPQQPQLLSFYCSTGAFYRWDTQHFFFFFFFYSPWVSCALVAVQQPIYQRHFLPKCVLVL